MKEEPEDSEGATRDGNNMTPETPPAPSGTKITKPKRVLTRRDALLNISNIKVIRMPCAIQNICYMVKLHNPFFQVRGFPTCDFCNVGAMGVQP